LAATANYPLALLAMPLPNALVEPKWARRALNHDKSLRRSHLFPLFDAAANFACSLLLLFPSGQTFDLPKSPWIIVVGDDLDRSYGPSAFHKESLDAAIKACEKCALITSGSAPEAYRLAATHAARGRHNVLLIETRPEQEEAWFSRINGLPTHCFVPSVEEVKG
jgi:hypothetical protein